MPRRLGTAGFRMMPRGRQALAGSTSLRYADGEYFFVLDPAGSVLAHGADPKLVGKNLMAREGPERCRLRCRDDGTRQGYR